MMRQFRDKKRYEQLNKVSDHFNGIHKRNGETNLP